MKIFNDSASAHICTNKSTMLVLKFPLSKKQIISSNSKSDEVIVDHGKCLCKKLNIVHCYDTSDLIPVALSEVIQDGFCGLWTVPLE